MDYWPNVDAVEWFAESVFPAVREKFPAAKFFVVGSRPDPRVKKLAEFPGVVVTGSVPDIRPYIAYASFAVAPLRIARGTQNKVLEAMAMAKTVIASPEAAQGVSAIADEELIVANGAAEFVQQITQRLGANEDASIGICARSRVIEQYSWDANLSRIGQLLDPPRAEPQQPAKHFASNDASRLSALAQKYT